MDLAALHGDGDGLVGGREGGFGRPDDVGLGLLAVGVEVLLEVAAAVHQRDGDDGSAGIGGGAEGVAGQHAEAAGVGGQGLGEGDLHGEVRDLAGGDVEGGGLLGAGAEGGCSIHDLRKSSCQAMVRGPGQRTKANRKFIGKMRSPISFPDRISACRQNFLLALVYQGSNRETYQRTDFGTVLCGTGPNFGCLKLE